MYAAILVFCALGTPPVRGNPTCIQAEYTQPLYDSHKACLEAVPGLIEKADAGLRAYGYEAYRIQGHECKRANAA